MLGSPRVLTDSAGNVVSRRDFLPFGEELYADGVHRTVAGKYSQTGQDGVRKRFTGYEKDPETSLDFAQARMYANTYGRFTAVDPLLASGKSANPQTFNRYTYVLNNPLLLTDPTGLQTGNTFSPDCDKDCNAHFDVKTNTVQVSHDSLLDVVVQIVSDLIAGSSPIRLDAAIQQRDTKIVSAVSSSDPLQNANYSQYSSIRSLLSGDDDGVFTSRMLGNRGSTNFSVLQQTQSSYNWAEFIGEANLTFQGLYASFAPGFAGGGRSAPMSTARKLFGASESGEIFPPIKVGSAGGPTAGQRFPQSVRDQVFAENPNRYCVFCRQPTGSQVDHAIASSRGGNATIDNAQLTCSFCNPSKGAGQFPKNPAPGYDGPFPPPWWITPK